MKIDNLEKEFDEFISLQKKNNNILKIKKKELEQRKLDLMI